MHQSTEIAAYPLSLALTRRVLNYLAGFRLFICLALLAAWLGGALVQGQIVSSPVIAGFMLWLYMLLAVALVVFTHRKATRQFKLAFVSLSLDVVFISLLLVTFGGLDSGLGVLLLFISTAAAILLPLRYALFVAALATIAIVGEAAIGGYLQPGGKEHLVRSGLYGLTLFIITLLAHALAFWMRDFRLIAERQAVTLTRLEQINELIIRRMRSGVLAVDRSGGIRMMNESAWYLLGTPQVSDRKLGEVSPELDAALEEWTRDPRIQSEPVTLAASQALVIPKFVSLPAGREINALIFLEDSDVVSRRALELSTSSLAKLSSGIAHEIRNPLAAISHASQLLAESASLGNDDVKLVNIIAKQSRRMNGIVENILQLARREKSQPVALALDAWLRSVAEEFHAAHPGQVLEYQPSPADAGLHVLFDSGQLHQVVWKLLENAAQHAGREGEEPRISLAVAADRPNEGYCILSVEDNGAGIRADQIGEIFEPFFTTRKEGAGLGLYIARQLCEANQAELTVDSAPGRYTRFQIRMALTSGPEQVTIPAPG